VLVPEEFHLLHKEGLAKYVEQRLPDLLGMPHEFKGRRKDGSEFPIEIALSLLSDAAPANSNSNSDGRRSMRILAAIRDLTERNKMRAVLVQNEKLASIGLLSAGVAHEINNPLAFVGNNMVVLERDCKGLLGLLELYGSGLAAIAQSDPELAARIQSTIEEIDLPYIQDHLGRLLSRTRDGIDRVTRIVHSLRGMARTEAPRRQDARIPDMINSALEIIHGHFKRLGVAVEQVHDERPVISCVPTQISQVVLNVLVNAYQAIEAAKRAQGKISIRTQRLSSEMLLEIKDNGAGIKPEHLPRLFDPFFTTKDVGEGTGLGLSISHHIISGHGGRIEVDSQRGEGACFRIFLPVKEPRNQP
jgi:two-component system NtrC family sensor kinase